MHLKVNQTIYFTVNESDQNMQDNSPEQIPCPVNFETPSVNLKKPSKKDLIEICPTTKIMCRI